MNINEFLDDIERQIKESTEKIINDNQAHFEKLVRAELMPGDRLFVANGTSLLKRGKTDSTEDEKLREITSAINVGVWELGFDYQYKTEIELK